MNRPVFGAGYAAAYDTLYGDKDYGSEAALVHRLVEEHRPDARSVLDLGCGTGRHALELAGRGYRVVGVDRSEPMLERARARATDAAASASFVAGDIRSVRLDERFDFALLLFAVLGYQLEDTDVAAALETARAHLEPGGLLLFDVWYEPAVLAQRPSKRTRVVEEGSTRLVRHSDGSLDEDRRVCTVSFRLERLEGEKAVDLIEEHHEMRYFSRTELERLLARSGFALVRLGGFPEFDREPSEETWSVLALARAV